MLQRLGGQAVTLGYKWVGREMGYRVADVTPAHLGVRPRDLPRRAYRPSTDHIFGHNYQATQPI